MPRSFKAGRLTFCVLVFAAVYPLVTALSCLTQTATKDWEIWQRHLLVVPVIVFAMVFVIIPKIQRLLTRLNGQAVPSSYRESEENR
jgi:antibiotic biosynthesis monooxygenase (ABM) superfamily enzyme